MSNDTGSSLLSAWLIFIKERFAPIEHLLMVCFLVLGNSTIACLLTGQPWEEQKFAVSFLVALMFFFRLRCFDEIKDYDVDVKVNPERPLARGLLTIRQVKIMFLSLTVIELGVTAWIGVDALLVHSVAIVYSYLMYKEFFIGKYLSPHLTTYALTHTFVSILVGYSIFAQNTTLGFEDFTPAMFLFGVVNWALFNLFEFARKTYAPQEERPNVDTYSSLFKPVGAGFLSLSQVAFGLAVLWFTSEESAGLVTLLAGPGLVAHGVAAGMVLLVTLFYMIKPSQSSASLFRGVCGAYLIVFFLLLSYQGLFL